MVRPQRWGGRRAPLLLSLGGWAIASQAMAQQSAQQAATLAALPAGSRQTSAELSVETDYDSNVAQSSQALAAQRGLALGEAIVTPQGSVSLVRPVSQQSVFVQGTVGYDYHTQNNILNRERIDLTGGGVLRLSRCQATPEVSYARQQTDLEDLSSRFVKNTGTTLSYGASASCTRAVGVTPEVSISETTLDNSVEIATNYHLLNATAGLNYNQPIIGQLGGYGQYQQVRFPNSLLPASTSDGQNGFDSVSEGFHFTHQVGARLSLDLRGAYTSVSPQAASSPGFHGPTYVGQATFKMSSRLTLNGLFQRAIQPSNFPGVTFIDDSLQQLRLDYAFAQRGDLSIGAADETRNYKGTTFLFPDELLNDRRETVSGSGRWRLNRHFTVIVDARWERRIADPGLYSFSGERVGVTGTAVF